MNIIYSNENEQTTAIFRNMNESYIMNKMYRHKRTYIVILRIHTHTHTQIERD